MMIDEQTIQFLLNDRRITQGMSDETRDSLVGWELIERLTDAFNAVLSTAQQVGFIKEELEGLKEKYEENCAELDMEMARLVNQCIHPSCIECEKDGLFLVICNICGGIVEEEISGIQ